MPDASRRPQPFALDVPLQSCLARAAIRVARPVLGRALGLEELARRYRTIEGEAPDGFAASALHQLGVRFQVRSLGSAGIPQHGAIIAAANHPTGALDGLVLAEAIRQVRPDVRIVANHLLAGIPQLAAACFFVDPFGGAEAAARSRAGLRAAHLWLREGGALVMFPAGQVAAPNEAAWHATLGRLAAATGAAIVPCAIDGVNSPLFYAAGRVHAGLRTLLLAREILNKRGRLVTVAIGTPRPARIDEPAVTMTSNARDAVARLSRTLASGGLARDVAALPRSARLLASGPFEVYCAAATALPNVLPEIGRLREITFRAVGEGTGRERDLDTFDDHYQHLFVWHARKQEVVGAYRLAATDRVIAERGVAGLYTNTLFRYDEALLRQLGPSFELGRSFVRGEYQRSYSALLLLWRGVGRILAASPHHSVLFGAVSISSRYCDQSQQMLRAFLARHHAEPGVEHLLSAVHPPSPLTTAARGMVESARIDDVDRRIRGLEGSQGIPVLLRQYLRLNASLLGFNVDPAFGDALDALMMVRVDRLPASMRERCFGLAPVAELAA